MKKIFLPLILLFVAGCSDPEPPTDAELIELYEKKKHIIKSLENMICRDKYQYINIGGFSIPKNIPKKRLKEYYELLNTISAQNIARGSSCNIAISMWSVGSGGVSKTKGYIKIPVLNGKIVSTLDDKHTKRKSQAFFYKQLNKDWYIYYYDWL